jgi:NAD(P)H-hydrate epimerase
MSLIKSLWRKRKRSSHKGDNGKVLIIGGSYSYVGALCLAGIAALRSGADIVTIATMDKVAWAVNSLSPDLITVKLKGTHFTLSHLNRCLKLSEDFDVVLIGNGLGLRSCKFVQQFVSRCKKPLVIDADAIKCIRSVSDSILTPHHREFEIFSGKKLTNNIKENIKLVQSVAGTNVILLKGAIDIVASSNRYKLNRKGNPGMTKAGTGDVLAGLCAGLVSQGLNKFDAAYESVKIVTSIADKQSRRKGYSYLASDLLKDIKRFI